MVLTATASARRSLWTILAVASVGAALALVTILGGPRSSIEAVPARVDNGHEPGDPDHADHRHASTLGDDGRFTGPGEVWPPEVRGATNVVTLDFAEEEAATEERSATPQVASRMAQAEARNELDLALSDARAQAALGERYTLISVTDDEIVPGTEKGDVGAKATLASFYSHSRGAAVEVYLNRQAVIAVASRPAGEHQPPLAVDEKYRATELARLHWEAAGDARIDQLEGFVILAVESGGNYYDSRVAYVSFHVDNVARPELLTWVDLTTELVLQAEVDR